jgi:glycosyltransferase involved in cell wall biosynthesis
MTAQRNDGHLSIIIPVGERRDDAAELYQEYKAGLAVTGRACQFIFVLDGPCPEFAAGLQTLIDAGQDITVVALTRAFGEATALMAGFEQASGEIILTLPAYHQIQGSEVNKLVEGMDSADMVIGRRWPRVGGPIESFRRRMFHGLIAWITGLRFNDLGCGARVMDRRVLEEISLYGDQHRFLALLADHQGFRVREVNVLQSPRDRFKGHYRAREYTHRVLDIFTVFFLVRFTKKPLRFFGMVGVSMFGVGVLVVLALVVQRLFFDQNLADRPALLLASLMVVLGAQLFALGLLGELIIFTHAKHIKDYQVDTVIHFPDARLESANPVLADSPSAPEAVERVVAMQSTAIRDDATDR